jgi:hypothetical protein
VIAVPDPTVLAHPVRHGKPGQSRHRGSDETIGDVVAALGKPDLLHDALTWPPDVFAITSTLLDRTEAYRFVVSPPPGRQWPPPALPDWEARTRQAARGWSSTVTAPGRPPPPPLLTRGWWTLIQHLDRPLAELTDGTAWPLATALLTLHAVADEACAGIGSATDVSFDPGCELRARAREHLAERGSLSRVPTDRLRVLPKSHLPDTGLTLRSLSRHVAASSSPARLLWLKAPKAPPRGPHGHAHSTLVLLPWPYHIHPADFRPAEGPLRNMDAAAYRFFEFAPRQPLDLDLVHRVLHAATRSAGHVDALVLPESAVDATELDELEDALSDHAVPMLVAGVRQPGGTARRLGANFVEFGINDRDGWRSYRQAKHHRWALDARQIRQYRLGETLEPSARWWEAIEIPQRGLQIVEMGQGVTLAPLICEDLARLDAATDLLRSLGPTLVVTPLLDGPQLASRWTSRYAAALADDPGSSVLTLTSLGMVTRSGLPGDPASRVVALWNDRHAPMQEIELAADHHAVLLHTSLRPTLAWTADGRCHRGPPSLALTDVVQLSAAAGPTHATPSGSDLRPLPHGRSPQMDDRQLTKLVGWCEAIVEAATGGDAAAVARLLHAARQRAPWRGVLDLPDPDVVVTDALAVVERLLVDSLPTATSPLTAILEAAATMRRSAKPPLRLTARVLTTVAWQRLADAEHADSRRHPPATSTLRASATDRAG